jgi:hypothetical protein
VQHLTVRLTDRPTFHGRLQRLLGTPWFTAASARRLARAKQATAADNETPASSSPNQERFTRQRRSEAPQYSDTNLGH